MTESSNTLLVIDWKLTFEIWLECINMDRYCQGGLLRLTKTISTC